MTIYKRAHMCVNINTRHTYIINTQASLQRPFLSKFLHQAKWLRGVNMQRSRCLLPNRSMSGTSDSALFRSPPHALLSVYICLGSYIGRHAEADACGAAGSSSAALLPAGAVSPLALRMSRLKYCDICSAITCRAFQGLNKLLAFPITIGYYISSILRFPLLLAPLFYYL